MKTDTGKRFGRLTLLRRIRDGSRAKWLCKCDCGNEKVLRDWDITHGVILSCGCLHKEVARKRLLTHGYSQKNSPSYGTWRAMRNRCYNPNYSLYHRYGGRGIQICARWFHFKNFLSDMGERPKGMSIDRINNDWSYMPSNCRWADRQTQNRHRIKFTKDGKTVSDYAKNNGLSYMKAWHKLTKLDAFQR